MMDINSSFTKLTNISKNSLVTLAVLWHSRQHRCPGVVKALLDGRVRLGESQVRLAESKCW